MVWLIMIIIICNIVLVVDYLMGYFSYHLGWNILYSSNTAYLLGSESPTPGANFFPNIPVQTGGWVSERIERSIMTCHPTRTPSRHPIERGNFSNCYRDVGCHSFRANLLNHYWPGYKLNNICRFSNYALVEKRMWKAISFLHVIGLFSSPISTLSYQNNTKRWSRWKMFSVFNKVANFLVIFFGNMTLTGSHFFIWRNKIAYCM